ncbi:MAG: glycosyltransferase [Planctomycetes bacterium]|jgi:dolichol-phosphate mannosyltransferase|nr:glycosyltransferase [Planctomycetota bacterium]
MTTTTARPRISFVIPLFNEQENLPELHRRLRAALDPLDIEPEIILVNDGSSDATPTMIHMLSQADPRVVGVMLSRNFGHQAAVSAGIAECTGDAVIVMDGDLQDPPEVLEQFIARWRDGAEVVYAVRTKRKEGLLKRTAYGAFYRLLRKLSDIDIPLDSGDFGLMDRKVVNALLALPERQRFVRGLRCFVGFRQEGLVYERAGREAGAPKYTFKALVRLAMDGLISFSSAPLNLITYLGLGSCVFALGLIAWVMGRAIIGQRPPEGWASTMVVVLFFGSVQLLSLGIIGEYLRRIFLEVKGRPTYIVRDVKRHNENLERRSAA